MVARRNTSDALGLWRATFAPFHGDRLWPAPGAASTAASGLLATPASTAGSAPTVAAETAG